MFEWRLLDHSYQVVVERALRCGQCAVAHSECRVVDDLEIGVGITIVRYQMVATSRADRDLLLTSVAVECRVESCPVAIDIDHSQRKKRIRAHDRVVERQCVIDPRAVGCGEQTAIGRRCELICCRRESLPLRSKGCKSSSYEIYTLFYTQKSRLGVFF